MTKNAILGKLTPFQNTNKILVEDQNTGDIIKGIISNHEIYKDEYDKISETFLGDNVRETARNVFNFLKSNVPYYIEPISKQTLRSPSAILALNHGADCKSYATFSNGIFDSLNRKGLLRVPIAYRFASYRNDTNEPQHVFSVLYPGTSKEIWIDPVLDRFDQRKEPTFYKDKKINMALIAMSGTSTPSANLQQMQAYRDKLVRMRDTELNSGSIQPGSSRELEYKVAINKVTSAIQDASINGIGANYYDDRDAYIGTDWTSVFDSVLKATPNIILATKGQSAPMPAPYAPSAPQGNNYSMDNLPPDNAQPWKAYVLYGAIALGVYFLFIKKK